MKTVILCGGQGTRIRDVTEAAPKPMVPIGPYPILWHIMKLYAHYGRCEFVLCLGYKGYVIKDFFLNYCARVNDLTVDLSQPGSVEYHNRHDEEGWKVTLVDTGERTMTGARVRRVAPYLDGEEFMLTYGDGVADVDLDALLTFHRAHGRVATVTGVRPPGRFGELEVGDGGRVTAFAEKPQASGGLINGGFMVLGRSFIERYLASDDPGLTLEREPLMRCAHDGELMVYAHEGYWQPMDTARDHALLNALWEGGQSPWKVW
jgi:glucose-1-phosphate cytidylyltransferase